MPSLLEILMKKKKTGYSGEAVDKRNQQMANKQNPVKSVKQVKKKKKREGGASADEISRVLERLAKERKNK